MSGRFLKNLTATSFPKSTKYIFVLQLSNGTKAFNETGTPFTQMQLTQKTYSGPEKHLRVKQIFKGINEKGLLGFLRGLQLS